MKITGIVVGLVFVVHIVRCSNGRTWRDDDILAAESWKTAESWTKAWIEKSLGHLEPVLSQATVSSTCSRDVRIVIRELRNMKPWAVKMLDAWAKVPAGILSGVSGFNGDYDLCLSIRPDGFKFQGKYCNMAVKLPVPHVDQVHRLTLNTHFPEFAKIISANETVVQEYVSENAVWYYRYSLKIGICSPSTCSDDDIVKLAKEVFRELNWGISIKDSQTTKKTDLSTLQICVLLIFGLLLAVVILATILESKDNSEGWKSHFSLSRNWRTLTDEKRSRYPFLDGIRVVLCHWTILLHTFSMFQPSALAGTFSSVELLNQPAFQLVANAWPTVDTFYCITSFLLATSMLHTLESSNGNYNFLKSFLRRIFRLSPTIWSILGLTYLAPLVGNGPHWASMFQSDVELCKTSWLPVVLFFNNWLHYPDMCLPQTWYLATDVQMYVVGVICVYMIYRNFNLGLKLCFGGIALSALWLGSVVYINDLHPSIIWETMDEKYLNRMLDLTYFGILPHLGPFLLGLLTGCFIHKFPTYRLGKVKQTLYWTFALCSLGLVLFAGHPWHNGHWPSPRNSALYQGSNKILWAFGICWIMFACFKGYGGFLNRFLSWSGFSTLSKLSFMMGMVNIPIIRFKNSLLRRQINLGLADLYYDFLGHYSVSLALSVLLYLLVESPFASLSESVFNDKKKKQKLK